MRRRTSIVLLFTTVVPCVVAAKAFAAHAADIRLTNAFWEIGVSPGALSLYAAPVGKGTVELSAGQADLGAVAGLTRTKEHANWSLKDGRISVEIRLDGKNLHMRIRSKDEGSFTWPIWRQQEQSKALIWPRAEGVYIPLDDRRWTDYLIEQGEWNTLESLSMPFWGIDCSGFSLTYIVTCPYNNAIRFDRKDGALQASFTHEFTRFQNPREYGFVISLGENNSPVEPARRFRRWLIDKGAFVDMTAKMKKVAKAERLLGAAHVYLWGDALFTRHDIPHQKWRPFCQELVRQAGQPEASPGRRIKQLMPPERWKQVVELADTEWPDNYIKTEVANALSDLLAQKDFYESQSWRGVTLPDEAVKLVSKDRDSLTAVELCRLNSLLLHAAFSNFVIQPDSWGDGVSTKMLERFKEAGFDRLRLCVSGWEGIERRPQVAKRADEMGYLFGTYDSFHSIHDPALRGTDQTWSTAQFDKDLFEKGPIVRKDGTKRGGFKRVGYVLSPIAARPYVEKRVRENMRNAPYSYYFVDCDAYGQVYDDYSPLHPAGQADDVAARVARLQWIGDTFKVVVGSEGGSAYAAPAIHVAEGIISPVLGWGDRDMADKKSKYYLGGYYPPDGPRVFVQQVPVKDRYELFYYDPRFRLPLYEIVFHDSVVATHHWANASLKFANVADTIALTELLYMTPPLYHMNLEEFEKHGPTMKRHYAFFSPLHRELGFARMTDFAWLSPDRLLQQTVFDDRFELVVNFSQETRRYSNIGIPGRSVLARDRDSGGTRFFTPLPEASETREK